LFREPRDLAASQAEKRPNDFGLREKSGEASWSGIAKNSDEDSFDLIVECVRRCDNSAKPFSLVAQKRPARETPFMLGGRRRLRSSGDERNVQLASGPPHKIDRALCSETGSVIEARDEKLRASRFGKRCGGMQHDHRVDPAGNGEKDAIETREPRCGRLFYCVSFMPSVSHGILI
jgi:hypothetical protein